MHRYQLDGYFNGGTAPWDVEEAAVNDLSGLPTCKYSDMIDGYLYQCATDNCKGHATLQDAQVNDCRC